MTFMTQATIDCGLELNGIKIDCGYKPIVFLVFWVVMWKVSTFV